MILEYWIILPHFKALESVNVKIWGPYPRNIPNSRPVSQAGLDFYELILDQFVQRGSLAARERNCFCIFTFTFHLNTNSTLSVMYSLSKLISTTSVTTKAISTWDDINISLVLTINCNISASRLHNLWLVLISKFSQSFILETPMLCFRDIRVKNVGNQGFWSKTTVFSLSAIKIIPKNTKLKGLRSEELSPQSAIFIAFETKKILKIWRIKSSSAADQLSTTCATLICIKKVKYH